MKLSPEEVRKIAHLARLHLTPEEEESYAVQLTDILTYMEQLKGLNTEGVAETSQVTGLTNVTRKDTVDSNLASPDELLDCSPLPKRDHQIRIKRMM